MKFLKNQIILLAIVGCFRFFMLIDLCCVRMDIDMNVGVFFCVISVPITLWAITYGNRNFIQMLGNSLMLFVWWMVSFDFDVYFGMTTYMENLFNMELVLDTDEVAGIIEVLYMMWVFGICAVAITIKFVCLCYQKVKKLVSSQNNTSD